MRETNCLLLTVRAEIDLSAIESPSGGGGD